MSSRTLRRPAPHQQWVRSSGAVASGLEAKLIADLGGALLHGWVADARYVTLNGANIGVLQDFGPRGAAMLEAGGAPLWQETGGPNGTACVGLSNTTALLRANGVNILTGTRSGIYVVGKYGAIGSDRVLVYGSQGDSGGVGVVYNIGTRASKCWHQCTFTGGLQEVNNTPADTTNWHLFSTRPLATVASAQVDGVEQSPSLTGNDTIRAFQSAFIGGANISTGAVAMLLIVNVATSPDVIDTIIKDYVRAKFGLGGSLALDKISVPALIAVSSARKLRAAYSGPCIRVRRGSDNAELDISFTAADVLDTAALLAFVGAGSGFVTTLYDQGPSGRNLTQTNTALQPVVVNAGALVTTAGGKPTMTLDTGRTLERADACGMTGAPALTMGARFRCPSAVGYPTLCRIGVSNFTTTGGIFSITLDESTPRIYVETIGNGCDFTTGGATTSKAWVARTVAGGTVSAFGLTENGGVCTVQSVSGNGAATTALANQRTAIGGGNGAAAAVYRNATGDANCLMIFNANFVGADLTALNAELAAHL